MKLFVVLLGGYNPGDRLEAHNLFIGAADELYELAPQMKKFWPYATHVDGYMILVHADGYNIELVKGKSFGDEFPKLMIANIGYYKEGEFAEFHKLFPLVLRSEKDSITHKLKKDPDFSSGRLLNEKMRSHVDDKHIITYFDVDDLINVQESIEGFSIKLTPNEKEIKNQLKLGYLLTDLKTM